MNSVWQGIAQIPNNKPYPLTRTDCAKCVCYYCYNRDCPHLVSNRGLYDYSRCHNCNFLGHHYKPLPSCDFFEPIQCRRFKSRFFIVRRKYKVKSDHQKILERIERLEKAIEKLYNK